MIKQTGIALVACLAAVSAMAQAAGPPTADVNVVNTPDVNVVNRPERIPVQVSETEVPCGVSSCAIELLLVPEGKRLVIEYFAVRAQLLPVGNAGGDAEVGIATEFDDQNQQIFFGHTTNIGPGANSFDVFGSEVHLYAQSGTTVQCFVLTPSFQEIGFTTCSMSGFLEDEE